VPALTHATASIHASINHAPRRPHRHSTISDALRFAGAFASLVCVYAVPAVVHARHSRLIGAFIHPLPRGRCRACLSLLLLGVGTAAVQFFPPAPDDKPPAAPSAPPPSSILGMAFQAAGM